MIAKIFASGSGGNCLLLSAEHTNILIDAGISMRRTVQSLADAGLSVCEIDGVLVTHEHSDHVSGLNMLAKKFDIPVFAPHTVANRLMGAIPAVEKNIHIIPVGDKFGVGEMSITAFHTPHDTDESVGYRVECGSVFALATDMGTVTDEIRQGIIGADTALIESNHDVDMLRYGPYPFVLKRRILSDRGHLSNADCAVLAAELADAGTRQIILGHLSKQNNTPDTAMKTVAPALEGKNTALFCAPEAGCLTITI